MKRLLHLGVPLGSEIMTTVRLATGGVCSLAGLDLERSEDCKVCVTESLLLLTHAGYREASIDFSEDEGLRARIAGEGEACCPASAPEDDISAALLEALAEDVSVQRQGDGICAIAFRFKR